MNTIYAITISVGLSLVACSHPAEDSTNQGATGTAGAALNAEDAVCDHDCKDGVPDGAKVETVSLGASPSRGPADAPVTVVVFSDFECPYCAKGEATTRALEAAYPGKVRVVFKNSPLPMHEHARLAAKASLAAGEQGKFWEYHDALFGQQDELDRVGLERAAEALKLDMPRFRAALDSARLEATVDADLAEAHRLGVKGTPAFFVNGRNIQGAQPLPTFRAKVDQALAER